MSFVNFTVSTMDVGVMTIAQVIFSVAWFKIVVRDMESYYLAADKGVRRVEHAIHRYPCWLLFLIDAASCAIRSTVLLFLFHACNSVTVVDYEKVALMTGAVSAISFHRHFAYQRPIQLFVSHWGFELCSAMVAALVCFFFRVNFGCA